MLKRCPKHAIVKNKESVIVGRFHIKARFAVTVSSGVIFIFALMSAVGTSNAVSSIYGNLYLDSLNGGAKKRLVKMKSHEIGQVAWQPNGDLIAYIAKSELSSKGWLSVVGSVDRKRSKIAQDVSAEGVTPDFIWSPDGMKIAYRKFSRYTESLHVIDMATRKRTQISEDDEDVGGFSWSPDAKSIYYTDGAHLYVADVVTGQKMVFYRSIEPETLDDVKVAPETGMVALSDVVEGIYLLTSTGRKLRAKLVRGKKQVMDFGWSPNGRWLAYTVDIREEYELLYAVQSDGSKRRRLSSKSGLFYEFKWTPNSRSIIIMDSDKTWPIKVNVGSRKKKIVKTFEAPNFTISWDGQYVAYPN